MDIFTRILCVLLSLDTIRATIAMLGWVKPDRKFAWLIYGRRDQNLISSALQELGFTLDQRISISKSIKRIAKELPRMTGITSENAAIQLVLLLSKYIVRFENPIHYGKDEGCLSQYYIDTMEIAHNEEELTKLRTIMTFLMQPRVRQKGLVLISPKCGNPIFAQQLSALLQTKELLAKSDKDYSRISSSVLTPLDSFIINYEGSWELIDNKKEYNGIVVDCNTTDGHQLLQIIKEINTISVQCRDVVKLNLQKTAFVLFCANAQDDNIDEKFKEVGAELVRFFDLDERAKELLYQLKQDCETQGRSPNILNDASKKLANGVIDYLKEKQLFYYKTK